MDVPLILVSNDDGIESNGLWAAAEAVVPLGEVIVVAPDRQWSGGARSMPRGVTGRIREEPRELLGEQVAGYAVDASPALAVDHGVIELAPRRPALVVSGINFGANLGIEVTISGTVGAALEAAAFGIPALAISQEMGSEHHVARNSVADFEAAKSFIRYFAEMALNEQMPQDVDVLNINVPASATPGTPWRLTRLSRHRYFLPVPPDRANGEGRPGYRLIENLTGAEPGSDIHAVMVGRSVSVTPLSLDLTSRVTMDGMERSLPAEGLVSQKASRLSHLFFLPEDGWRGNGRSREVDLVDALTGEGSA
jgi:5'-nucleotidase